LEASDFGPDDLMGILGGPLSDFNQPGHALVPIDLDAPEAVEKADEFLPSTGMEEGRPGKPRDHRYFLVPLATIPEWAKSTAEQGAPAAIKAKGHPGPAKKGFNHAQTKKRVVDFIGTGAQIVCPSPGANEREWVGGSPGLPATVPFPALWDAVCKLAVACGAKVNSLRGKATTLRVPSIVERAKAYLAKMPPAISGKGGHNQTLEAARVVVRGFDLGPEVGYQLLRDHYNPRCQPEWSEKELRHKCDEADTVAFDKPRGWLLKDDRSSSAAQGASVGSVGRRTNTSDTLQPPRKIPAYRTFPLSALPVVVREYVDASAAAIGCDPALVAVPTLATVAGAIGNSRAILLKRGWVEPPIIWGITLAYSGEKKTAGYEAAVNPLLELQMDLNDKHEDAVARHKEELSNWMKKDKAAQGTKPEPPPDPPCYMTSDATIECVGDLLSKNPRGLLLARDELDAWFQSFTRYKGKAGGTDRPHWLELHRAGALRIHRLTREPKSLSVRRACSSVTGTVQPGIMERSFDDDALAAGLLARFLLCMPPAKLRRWTEAEVSEELSRRYADLLSRLLALTLADDKKRKPRVLGMTGEAKRVWVAWYNAWGERMAASEGEQVAALAKLEAYAVRLALIHHVVTLAATGATDLRPVGVASLRAGTDLAEWFAEEARRVYATLRESAEERNRRRLIDFIAARGSRITPRDLQRANSKRWPTRAAAVEDLDALAKLNLGTWETIVHASTGGHDVQRFLLHPTPDTSDTRSGAEKPPSDTCSDTRSETCEFPGEYERVSEVSGVGQRNGECEGGACGSECRTRVSDGPIDPDADPSAFIDENPYA
jgi:hypothetical protein